MKRRLLWTRRVWLAFAATMAICSSSMAQSVELSDNLCRNPQTAKMLMDQFNSFEWAVPLHAVDIEQLVTVSRDEATHAIGCHGLWVLTSGAPREGTLTFHPNVAGEIIAVWRAGPVPYVAPPTPYITTPLNSNPGALPQDAASPSFAKGRTDRQTWEKWIVASSGEYQTGALYWASVRSKSGHLGCTDVSTEVGFLSGCLKAQQFLTPVDRARKTDAQYWYGWNNP